MQMTPVKSTNLEAVGYDPASTTLTVQFKGGKRWAYDGVPQDTYDALMQADSIGSYFHANIRNQFDAAPVAAAESEES